jgi:hypothetical protein
MLVHKTLDGAPWNVLRNRMKYAILMPHGLAPFSCPKPSPNDSNQEESMPCALSTKIQPDSRDCKPKIEPAFRFYLTQSAKLVEAARPHAVDLGLDRLTTNDGQGMQVTPPCDPTCL